MSIVEEYKHSLKMAEVEEVLDLIFYRPIAFVFVKAVYRTPLTPNLVSLLSMAAGMFAAMYFSKGTGTAFVWAGCCFTLANVLDCADGQLARMQGSGSPYGRIVDGVLDWVITIAVLVGLAIGLSSLTGDSSVWYLVVGAGLSSAVHAMVFDYVQQEYISGIRGERPFMHRELERVETALRASAPMLVFKRIGLRIYRWYMLIQRDVLFGGVVVDGVTADEFRSTMLPTMRLWTLLGSTTNRSILILTSLFHRPELYCWTILVVGNAYLVIMAFRRRRIVAQLRGVSHD